MRRRVRVNKSKINLNHAKSVTFVFENCDVAEVPFRYIDTFAIDGLCDYIAKTMVRVILKHVTQYT